MDQLIFQKSFFLFGSRSTGKTTLLHTQFPNLEIINMLSSATYLSLAENPASLISDGKQRFGINPGDKAKPLKKMVEKEISCFIFIKN